MAKNRNAKKAPRAQAPRSGGKLRWQSHADEAADRAGADRAGAGAPGPDRFAGGAGDRADAANVASTSKVADVASAARAGKAERKAAAKKR